MVLIFLEVQSGSFLLFSVVTFRKSFLKVRELDSLSLCQAL